MIFSMTGYGRGSAENEQYSMVIEMKYINNRYLDMYVRMPRQLLYLEETVKAIIKQKISRGKMDVFVTFTMKEGVDKKLTLNKKLAEEYLHIAEGINEIFSLSGGMRAIDLMKFPDVVSVTENELEEDVISSLLKQATERAVQSIMDMRAREGKKLSEDISARSRCLLGIIEEIESKAEVLEEEYRNYLMEKLNVILEKLGERADEQRIVQEAAIIADRSAITEEIVRFKSHVQQLLDSLDVEEPVGRKLDFIIQEMNREINTIGSKSDSLEIVDKVVVLKSELEKIREQIQNLE